MNNISMLLTTTINTINQISNWLLLLVAGLLTLRLGQDLYSAYEDPEIGLKESLKKAKKRIFACVIAVTAASLVTWIKNFYT